ncbi:MAG: hypothetical protein OEN50_13325 [Deltaproteobacteria bacterium]|nr:hypothetical protein [Deltaproteobacteria bacterium]
MNIRSLKAGIVSFSAAMVASLCCLLPLAVILLGVGSGAFMMVTMQYRSIFLPVGVIGVALGYLLYFRERRRCDNLGCRFVGRKSNFVLLLIATAMVSVALILDIFPSLTSEILQRVM